MNTRYEFLSAAFALLGCLAAPTLMAQNAPTGVPGAAPAAPPPPPDVAPVEQHVETIVKDAVRGSLDAVRSATRAAHAAVNEIDLPSFQFGSGARSSSRSLAILTTSTDAQKVDDLEEDLSVMARILQKAAKSLREEERNNAMGIYLDGPVFGTSSGARNLYIEGHGAVFLLTVGYPLVGPRDPEKAPAEPAAKTEWEKTQDELRGVTSDSDGGLSGLSGRKWTKAEAFDEHLVDNLKTTLLDTIKQQASNIRGLGPDENVTVVVQGGDVTEGTLKVYAGTSTNGNARAEVRVRKEVRSSTDKNSPRKIGTKGESVMNIRVKKSDIDALAAGKLSDADFRNRATVQTYLRRSEPVRPPRR